MLQMGQVSQTFRFRKLVCVSLSGVALAIACQGRVKQADRPLGEADRPSATHVGWSCRPPTTGASIREPFSACKAGGDRDFFYFAQSFETRLPPQDQNCADLATRHLAKVGIRNTLAQYSDDSGRPCTHLAAELPNSAGVLGCCVVDLDTGFCANARHGFYRACLCIMFVRFPSVLGGIAVPRRCHARRQP